MTGVAMCLAALAAVAAIAACGGRTEDVAGQKGPFDPCPAPSAVTSGAACSSPGTTCPSTGIYDCQVESTGPVQCSCAGGVWSCDGVDAGCSPPQPQPQPGPEPCPPPSSIHDGEACHVSSSDGCTSDIAEYGCDGGVTGYETCNCTDSTWNCSPPELIACPEAGPPPGCPDPNAVRQGLACADPGEVCAGAPSWCEGQLDYDAFECEGGFWNDVATTVCEGEAGVEDAGAADGSVSD